MVDEKTTNKNYPLPNPENIASQDVERIANALTMIDSDIKACDDSIGNVESIAQTVSDRSLHIPEDKVGVVNTELQNLEARKYITVNSDGTGFTTVEGGGGEGGKKGEVLVKKSDENFDTTWIDPRAVLSKAFKVRTFSDDANVESNSFSRLNDEIDNDDSDQLQRVGISPRQITGDTTADTFSGYIVKDEVEENSEEDDDIATTEKFGRVKIGSGINVDNGVISVPTIGVASKDDLGLVRIGTGIEVSKGVISVPEYKQATSEEFGTVKLSDDFTVGTNGELKLAQLSEDADPVIYQSAKVNVCGGNCVVIQEDCVKYRLFVNEDSVISFDWSQITPQNDISFDVELYSTDDHVISFNISYPIIWEIPCTAVVPGKTVIRFSKLFNVGVISASMVEQDENAEKLLTAYADGNDIASTYKCNILDGAWSAGDYLNPSGNWYWSYIGSDGYGVWSIDFMRSTYVQRINVKLGSDSVITWFYVEGSKDGVNWIKLYDIQDTKFSDTYDLSLTNKGLYRHYRIRHSGDMYFGCMKFYGYDVDDRLFELRRITPRMFANSANGVQITAHTEVNAGNLYYITSNALDQYAQFSTRDENQDWWMKYELPEAKVVDFIDFGYGNDRLDLAPSWFSIEASNDDETWDLLIERQTLKTMRRCHGEQYLIDNTTAYKYYKLTVHETEDANYCRFYRWRLFKIEDGIRKIDNFVPKMVSSEQDGYEASANSQYDSGHMAFYAFDGTSDTRWSSSGSAPDWIQIKFPEAVVCNAVEITSRNDGYYNQAPRDFMVQASVDGENWDTLDTETGVEFTQNESKLFDFDNDQSYQYYRVYVTANNGGSTVAIGMLKFGQIQRDYKRVLNGDSYIVPITSSNPFDGGDGTYTITASSEHSEHKMFYLFDRRYDTKFELASGTNGWVQIELPKAKIVNKFSVGARSDGYCNAAPRDYSLLASNDAESWTTLFEISDSDSFSGSESRYHSFDNSVAYKYYKLLISNPNNSVLTFAKWDLFYHSEIKEY